MPKTITPYTHARLPIANGATTPVPLGGIGSECWSTIEGIIVVWSGTAWTKLEQAKTFEVASAIGAVNGFVSVAVLNPSTTRSAVFYATYITLNATSGSTAGLSNTSNWSIDQGNGTVYNAQTIAFASASGVCSHLYVDSLIGTLTPGQTKTLKATVQAGSNGSFASASASIRGLIHLV
jgi:hypothetical protein